MASDDGSLEMARPAIRIVGFKVADASPSPTSVLRSGESPSSTASSPRSNLAEALRQEAFHPMPKLRIAARRLKGLGFKRSLSHADLVRDCSSGGSPPTPGSRASTASTPMRIPSV